MVEYSISNLISNIKSVTLKEKELITKAYKFAEEAHKDQKRKSGDPYFVHLFETAKNLAELEMSAITISAGLLHDSIEDVGVTAEEIKKEFGSEILFLVEGVTKLGEIKYRGSDRHNESLRKLFVAMSQDIRVLIIKLCDRLHNMETLSFVPKEKQKRIAAETLEIYTPIAYRLGIRKLSRKLENLSFPFVYPKEYKEMKDLIETSTKERRKGLEKIRRTLTKKIAEADIRNFRTDYRVKGLYSLYKKYLKYNKDVETIYDISALRVIVETTEDCYRILGIIHGLWTPLPGRIKDFIAFPKPNGYQSLHTTVFAGDGNIVEIQIKTEGMYLESEYGIASHISYKSSKKSNSSNFDWIRKILPFREHSDKKTDISQKEIKFEDVPDWIRDLVDYQKSTGKNAMDDIKSDFFQHRIFLFTPKGDVIDLPIDSSPIDFAYSIHSDIGNCISGAKVNGKMISIDSNLQSGDIVEILTSKKSKPKRKWLKYVKTTAAKKHIQQAVSKETKN